MYGMLDESRYAGVMYSCEYVPFRGLVGCWTMGLEFRRRGWD